MEEKKMESDLKLTYIAIFFAALTMIGLVFLVSCSYSITQIQTREAASDVFNETETNTLSTSVSPTFKLPAGAIL